jgi:hypothetical protein
VGPQDDRVNETSVNKVKTDRKDSFPGFMLHLLLKELKQKSEDACNRFRFFVFQGQ